MHICHVSLRSIHLKHARVTIAHALIAEPETLGSAETIGKSLNAIMSEVKRSQKDYLTVTCMCKKFNISLLSMVQMSVYSSHSMKN